MKRFKARYVLSFSQLSRILQIYNDALLMQCFYKIGCKSRSRIGVHCSRCKEIARFYRKRFISDLHEAQSVQSI